MGRTSAVVGGPAPPYPVEIASMNGRSLLSAISKHSMSLRFSNMMYTCPDATTSE
jgi:hypothetical protein